MLAAGTLGVSSVTGAGFVSCALGVVDGLDTTGSTGAAFVFFGAVLCLGTTEGSEVVSAAAAYDFDGRERYVYGTELPLG